MQFRFAFATLSLAILAAANPARRNEPASSCNTGPVQCCQIVEKASETPADAILAVLGIMLPNPASVIVGVTCTPVTAIGLGAQSCNAQTVCCADNTHGPLISIGCVPVTIGL